MAAHFLGPKSGLQNWAGSVRTSTLPRLSLVVKSFDISWTVCDYRFSNLVEKKRKQEELIESAKGDHTKHKKKFKKKH